MEQNDKFFGYISFVLALISAAMLATVFIWGIYSICSSALCALASLAFLKAQYKKCNFKLLKTCKIIAYTVFILIVAILIGGIIYSATA